ncbi:hypothetical protein [Phytohabitans rumicis]|uniref:Uncharacterized protein n=1 Tax=Phytohabitans rumicis TaxID=1076125 RepID=A0A6V8LAY9_9ACTN|nr:hypothetical protein [Phytohabitans rumicis]GFJ94373.1 hypothetical protein Prum_080150 [Phytohabitans rumicis]
MDLAHRCEALFASDLQYSQHPAPQDVRAAVIRTLDRLGEAACLARMAQEFGDHPDTAAARMRWAREAVALAYAEAPIPTQRACLVPTA